MTNFLISFAVEVVFLAGWLCMFCGLLASIGLVVGLTLDYCWRKAQAAYGWVWLKKAIRHYRKIEMPPNKAWQKED